MTIIMQRHTLFEFHNRNLDIEEMQISPLGLTKNGVAGVDSSTVSLDPTTTGQRSKFGTTICTTCLVFKLKPLTGPAVHAGDRRRKEIRNMQFEEIRFGVVFLTHLR